MVNLHNYYKSEIVKDLLQKYQYKSVMQVPKVIKVTINMGIGKATTNKKFLEKAIKDLMMISGQKPIITKAHKSISSFKIRKGQSIGCKVTLRKTRMWEFLERFIYITMPRIRDFRGLSLRSFDGRGNYSIGIHEQIIFPEIDYDTVDDMRGMNITITTNANSDNEAHALLSSLHFPFRK
ncbi:50S ribosomal protein L5 [Candidatus Blochmannia ocreatus (nom. nud.)]|uniref:Large ribosomal subunit protein uL5 n=1 Tax=Candidatus Blochmannia ocreatus (nom. nud.) TaxID=251538 RepID=A0ABY4STI4_9ENTR|nr:50S ribosomal protein L5 [Candidatus Blochmannia ocreatus]URJ25280.1 50S ribosomal protein L5 [Candidatus Blochmannia ocreatus]